MNAPVLEVRDLTKIYGAHRGTDEITALDGVSFNVPSGGSLAVVGESGSGKSTCARIICGLEAATSGEVAIAGVPDHQLRGSLRARRRRAKAVQLVFQDPYSSLDPRQRVGDALAEVARNHGLASRTQARLRAAELFTLVGLTESLSRSFPHSLSGGQRQRVALARALVAEPQVLVLDEAVAALDVSIQAQVLNVLSDVRAVTGVALVFITHDLVVANLMSDDVVVMKEGRIVEAGASQAVLGDPTHPYTRRLLAAVPRRGWKPSRNPANEIIDNLQEE